MAWIGVAFVNVDAFVILGRSESGSALANGFAVLNLAQTVVAFHGIARIDAFEGLLVAGAILWTVFVFDTVDPEAANFRVVWVASGGRRAAARRLMIDNGAEGVWTTGIGGAGIGASFGAALTDKTSQLIGASGTGFTLVGSDASLCVAVTNCSGFAGTAEGSGRVGALSGGMARPALALVNVDAVPSRSGGESRSTATLTVSANLAVGAVGIRSTSWPAATVDTDFTGHAVVVAVADLDTLARQTALSPDAGVGHSFATGWVAATGLTSMASWASRSRLTVERVPHASLLGSWSSHKS
jgi:hypothetical protein